VGKVSKEKKKKKKNPSGGQGEYKVLRKKKKTEIRAKKGQRKNANLGWQRDRKENPNSRNL
jgi:hypothetical protein